MYAGISHQTLNAICLTETLEKEQSFECVRNWVNSVRRGCQAIGRGEAADIQLGKLMARSFYDAERVQFPMNFYRLLTEVDSSDFQNGIVAELKNSNGWLWNSEKPRQDRSECIRAEIRRVWNKWPGGVVLMKLLENSIR